MLNFVPDTLLPGFNLRAEPYLYCHSHMEGLMRFFVVDTKVMITPPRLYRQDHFHDNRANLQKIR